MSGPVRRLVELARGGDTAAARGLDAIWNERRALGRAPEPELLAWMKAGHLAWLKGEARSLDAALGLVRPKHRPVTLRGRLRSRAVREMVADLMTEWERRTVRGELRYLSARKAAEIIAILSRRLTAGETRTRNDLMDQLRGCNSNRKRELVAFLLAPPGKPGWVYRRSVPRGLTAHNVSQILKGRDAPE